MKKESIDKTSFHDHLGCLGNFSINDPICKKLCALRVRCAIEQDQNLRMELMEDIVSFEDMHVNMH